MSKTVIAFGELLWDVFPEGEVLGGAPANFAYRMHSLGHKAIIVSRVGKDDRGRRAIKLLKQRGLRTDYIQIDDSHPTGSVPVAYNDDGTHEFTILPNVAYDLIEPATTPVADAICFGTLVQRSFRSRDTLYQLLDQTDALKVLDLNLRRNCFSAETIEASLQRADILKLNKEEAGYLSQHYGISSKIFSETALSKWELRACVVTLGADGVTASDRSGTVKLSVPGVSAPIIDTVGCGDAFTAMFLHRYLEGASLSECCEAGNALGAAVARTRGGMAPVLI